MRKFALAALISLAAVSAGAQTFSDALTFSGNNYYGTARSIALGNAMTALGGDLGSVGINPAGSAVAPYSQFTISPGLVLSGNNAGYSTGSQEDYSNFNMTDRTKFTVPNIAISTKFDTYQTSGLKSFTISWLSNTTSQYLNDFSAGGRNSVSSLLGSFAAGAFGYTPDDLLNRDNYFDSSIPWNYIMAYRSGMISEVYLDGSDEPYIDNLGNYSYIGTTESMYRTEDGKYEIKSMGDLDQYSHVETFGSKSDIIMNVAMNFSDKFFLGFNLGLPIATYHYNESFRETAVDPSQFGIEYEDGVIANFSHATYAYSQTTDISGVYGKVGAIWLPFDGLRLGAAIQTPTLYNIEDTWCVDGMTSFTNSIYTTSESSPLNEYSYNLRTPWRFNFGAAYTFGGRGLISADLDVVDYKSMKYSPMDRYYDYDSFEVENSVNRNFGGLEYYGRFGAEFRLIPEISVRAGYTFKTSPSYFRFDQYGDKYTPEDYLYYYDEFYSGRNSLTGREAYPEVVNSYSLGFGYSSEGSFFADVAFRLTHYPAAYFNPYNDYFTGGTDYLPEVVNTRNITDMVLTLGWRF